MDQNELRKSSEAKIPNNRDVFFYEDDGFFSDVPASGSLSKSVIAMNRYLKTNLLYDDSEPDAVDAAYFSKESSPKDSIAKYDTDSTKSNDSIEKQNLPSAITENELSNIAELVNHADKLTDDYKSMQLMEKSKNKASNSSSPPVETIYKDDQFQIRKLSSSIHNLSSDHEIESENHQEKPVALRGKTGDVKINQNRHTVHEPSDWANRTKIYPDVYAPLPYSEYLFITMCSCIFFTVFNSRCD